MADLNGIPLGLHIANTTKPLGFGWRFAICGKGALIAKHLSKAGFNIIENHASEQGLSHSLHLAVRAAQPSDATALIILLADMPFVSVAHVAAVIAQKDLVASTDGRKLLPPAFFPRAYWPDLLETSGDSGARGLLARAKLVRAPLHELRDIDVADDMPKPQA